MLISKILVAIAAIGTSGIAVTYAVKKFSPKEKASKGSKSQASGAEGASSQGQASSPSGSSGSTVGK